MSPWKTALIAFASGMALEFLIAGPLGRWRRSRADDRMVEREIARRRGE